MDRSFVMKLVLPSATSTKLEQEVEMLKSSVLYADHTIIVSSELEQIYDAYLKYNVIGRQLKEALIEENEFLAYNLKELQRKLSNEKLTIGDHSFPFISVFDSQIRKINLQSAGMDTVIRNFEKILPFIKNNEIEIGSYDVYQRDSEGVLEIDAGRSGALYLGNLLADALDYEHYTVFEKGLFNDVDNLVNRLPHLHGEQRYRHAGFVQEIMPTLPNFSIAELNELSDIKLEFQEPLDRFRRKVYEFSSQISNLPWEAGFRDECRLIYEMTIKEAVDEIDEKMKAGTLMANICKNFLQVNLLELAGGISASLLLNDHIGAIAAALAAGKVSKEVISYFEELSAAKKNHMYFYYIAGKKLVANHK